MHFVNGIADSHLLLLRPEYALSSVLIPCESTCVFMRSRSYTVRACVRLHATEYHALFANPRVRRRIRT